jgi:hypothetical protein
LLFDGCQARFVDRSDRSSHLPVYARKTDFAEPKKEALVTCLYEHVVTFLQRYGSPSKQDEAGSRAGSDRPSTRTTRLTFLKPAWGTSRTALRLSSSAIRFPQVSSSIHSARRCSKFVNAARGWRLLAERVHEVDREWSGAKCAAL